MKAVMLQGNENGPESDPSSLMCSMLQNVYEAWKEDMSAEEQQSVDENLALLKSDSSQSFGIYNYLNNQAKATTATEGYRGYINEVTDAMLEEKVVEKIGRMQTMLLRKV
jgi:hypothetical protein